MDFCRIFALFFGMTSLYGYTGKDGPQNENARNRIKVPLNIHLNQNKTMSKFQPMELIDKMSGKFHSKSKYYAAERYGTQYTGKMGENNTPPSAAQIAQRTRFANAKSKISSLSSTEIDAYKESFKKQTKYRSFQGYMQAMEMAKIGG